MRIRKAIRALLGREDGHRHICASQSLRLLLRSLAAHVGHPRPYGASETELAVAIMEAHDALEQRAETAERVLRDLLGVYLGAQPPPSMVVDPEAIFRQLVVAHRRGREGAWEG